MSTAAGRSALKIFAVDDDATLLELLTLNTELYRLLHRHALAPSLFKPS